MLYTNSRSHILRTNILSKIIVFIFGVSMGHLNGTDSVENLSITPSYNPPTHGNQRVFLITFAAGEVHERNQNCLALSALNMGIDTIILYRKRHIDTDFYQKNQKILDVPRGSGYWLWKPYFILETLKTMAPDDILIYVDSGIYIKDSMEQVITQLNRQDTDIVLFWNNSNNRTTIKRDTFDIMGVDYKHRDSTLIDAALLAVKKTPYTCDFIEKWLNYCCIEQAMTDSSSEAPEFEGFIRQQGDQTILSLMYWKYQDNKIKLFDRNIMRKTFAHHRRRLAEKPLEITGLKNLLLPEESNHWEW